MSTQTTTDRFLARDGACLRWQLAGAGPTIVLLHGWALDLAYWDPLVARLTSRFTVLRFDRRGFGLSSGSPDIDRNVDDLQALLDAAGINRAVLIGMSQGARFALHFALEHPAHTRALLLDGAPALEAESELPLDLYRRRLQEQGPAALQADLRTHPLMQPQTSDPDMQRLLATIITRYEGHDLLQSAAHRRTPDLAAISMPTLLLNGAHDSTARREATRQLHAAIPGAQCVELAGAGHLAALDDPASYARAVIEFCAQLPP